ncbi:histidine kinase [Lipingzhangella sp. LS1_29]|uniref:histidine kinase n=1 Tax=Lipingzhangella rawalii TaxID=2055835 RepID=A0ABU2H0U3_9ACTN|nr:histidine kinase [Lipingzhangella rawalii]MDS1268916.1 histidine kinase [Lipingzhangella rawalii]
MFHGEEERLRDAFGERPVRIWRWWWNRRFRIADWIYAAALFPWAALINLTVFDSPDPGTAGGPLYWGPLPLSWTVGPFVGAVVVLVVPALVSATVLLRRSRPRWLLGAALLLLVAFGNPVAVPLALYSYAVWFTDRRGLAAWTLAMFGGTVFWVLVTEGSLTTIVVVAIVMIALPLTIGLWVGTRRLLIANLRERAERLEREHHLEAQRARAAERTRIAREMHDVVAHRVSLMVLHAGGLEVSAPDPATSEGAALIRSTGREALTELREILGVLRDDTDIGAGGDAAATEPVVGADSTVSATTPQPRLADLDRLVAEWRGLGRDVEVQTTGHPRALSAQIERTVYRTVQEGLTNAARHAPGSAVRVRIRYSRTEVEVTVTNGPATTAAVDGDTASGSGYGLTGLRERLALVQGSLNAGPYPDGGWRIRAAVPLPASPSSVGEAGDATDGPGAGPSGERHTRPDDEEEHRA